MSIQIKHQNFEKGLLSSNQKQDLPGVENLGCGYNVFGEYANPKSITYNLFNFKSAPKIEVPFNKDYIIPNCIETNKLESSYYKTISGESLEIFTKKLNIFTKLDGEYSFFKGSISVNYDKEQYSKTETEFSFIEQIIAKWDISISPDKGVKFLIPEVLENINKLEPLKLFEKYGTHFLSGIVIGGKVSINDTINKNTYKSSKSIEIISQMSYESLTLQINAENKTNYSEEIETFNKNRHTNITTLGGKAELGGSAINIEGGFNKWKESVGSNPGFVGFKEHLPLTPIWELCSNNDRIQELKAAFEIYALMQTKSDTILLTDLKITTELSSDMVPSGYKKYPFDLKKGEGGKWVFLCYKENTIKEIIENKINVISDIKFIKGNTPNLKVDDGYTKIDFDLNKGHGGQFIYICFKTIVLDIKKTKEAINEISIISDGKAQSVQKQPCTRLEQDINEGQGGKFTYLCFSKEK